MGTTITKLSHFFLSFLLLSFIFSLVLMVDRSHASESPPNCTQDDFGATYSECDPTTNQILIVHYKKNNCVESGTYSVPPSNSFIPCNITCSNGEYLKAPATQCAKCEKGHFSFSEGEYIHDWSSMPTSMVTSCDSDCQQWVVSKNFDFISSGDNANKHNINSVLSMTTQIVRESGSVEFLYKVDSDRSGDGLEFRVNNKILLYKTPVTDGFVWAKFKLDRGAHLLQWMYKKNSRISKGKDRAYIKEIKIYGSKRVVDSCEKCPVGTYADSEGQSECKPCAKNEISKVSGATACTQCKDDEYALEGKECKTRPNCEKKDFISYYTQCNNGTRTIKWRKISDICKGDFPADGQKQVLNVPCLPCPYGMYRDPSSKCVKCAGTKYFSMNDRGGQCMSCPSREYALKKLSYDRNYFTEYSQIPEAWKVGCYGTCPSDAKFWQVATDPEQNDAYIISNTDVYGDTLTLGIDINLNTRGKIELDYEIVNPSSDPKTTVLTLLIDGVTVLETNAEAKPTKFVSDYLKSGTYSLFLIFEKYDCEDQTAHVKIKSLLIEGEATGAAQSCEECQPGYGCLQQSDKMIPCPPGYTSKLKSETCEPCPSNTYSDKPGQPKCKPCGYGTTSDYGSTECTTNCVFVMPGAEDIAYNLTDLHQQVSQDTGAIGPFTPLSSDSKLSYYFSVCSKFDTSKTSFCHYPDIESQLTENRLANTSATFKAFSCAQSEEYTLSQNAGDKLSFVPLGVENRHKGITVEYQSPYICDEEKQTNLKTRLYLKCDPEQGLGYPTMLTQFKTDDDIFDSCLVEYEWKSIVACPACTQLDYDSAFTPCFNGTRTKAYFPRKGVACYPKGITPTSSTPPPDEVYVCPVCTKKDYYAVDTKCIDGKFRTTYAWKEPRNCSDGVTLPKSVEKDCEEVELQRNTAIVLVGIASGIFVLLFGGLVYLFKKHQTLYANYSVLSNQGVQGLGTFESYDDEDEELDDSFIDAEETRV